MEGIQKNGQVIQQRRGHLRITQRQLADMADIEINTYKIETGQANPTLQSLQDILGMEITLQTKKVSIE